MCVIHGLESYPDYNITFFFCKMNFYEMLRNERRRMVSSRADLQSWEYFVNVLLFLSEQVFNRFLGDAGYKNQVQLFNPCVHLLTSQSCYYVVDITGEKQQRQQPDLQALNLLLPFLRTHIRLHYCCSMIPSVQYAPLAVQPSHALSAAV